MDYEKDLFEQFDVKSNETPHSLKPECIIVDKVFDSCFQRECEPSKVVDLTGLGVGPFICGPVTFGPGFIVEGTLQIAPIRLNFVRVKFCFRVPFTLTVRDTGSGCNVTKTDFVEFCKDIEMFLPEAPSEFSFDIVIETRSQLLRCEIVGLQAILSIGTFIIVKVVGKVQLSVQSFGFCPQPKECVAFSESDVCKNFEEAPFPRFFPPQFDEITLDDD